ncbi:hypothetical protein C8J57DRAFT_1298553 [Mycena rebaudengoi]|nr:hypothetical protein C8J57DRAFT_1298553 [Mycena rebaudengoi]
MSTNKKFLLPPAGAVPQTKSSRRRTLRAIAWSFFFFIVFMHLNRLGLRYLDNVSHPSNLAAANCPQVDVLLPKRDAELWERVGDLIGTDDFKTKAINWLAGAVRVPTEVFDTMGPIGEDPRWETFGQLHDYLQSAFPLVYSTLSVQKVNTYGLLYEWAGSDKSLKPVLLAAHQDVVPVEPLTYGEWTHPPYSGYFDGRRIWGRGSSDDKSGLIAILTSIETLLAKNFKPTRTFVLAFGFDEEASGLYGAAELGKAMRSIYGDDEPFAFVIDEGGGFSETHGSIFAVPAVAEKGNLDVSVEVTSPGGHSSVPPAHTTIGILAALLVKYEENPYKLELSRDSIVYSNLQCLAAHGATIPRRFKKLIKRSAKSKLALRALEKVLSQDIWYRSLIGTTQAIDIIQGGVKSNALPEQAFAVVNHRISTQSSVGETQAHDTALLKSLASKFNLTYKAFGATVSEEGAPAIGTLTLKDAWGTAFEPAPVSPISGDGSAAYKVLSGTIKAAYNAHRSLSGSDTIVIAPGMSTGNTDTRYYWKLSRSIFRYNHNNAPPLKESGVHTVNESMNVDALLEMIRFFSTLILNADESTAI